MSGAETVSRLLENAPLPQLVQNLAKAIAESQFEIDKIMIQQLQILADADGHGVQLPGEETKRSMLELGFAPTFYHFSEMNIRARVAFSSMETTEIGVGGSVGLGYGIVFASVNAHYTNRYSFNAEGSSEIDTKIIAVPPPAELTEVISDMVARRKVSSSV